jgi:hypothetical protein
MQIQLDGGLQEADFLPPLLHTRLAHRHTSSGQQFMHAHYQCLHIIWSLEMTMHDLSYYYIHGCVVSDLGTPISPGLLNVGLYTDRPVI